MTRPQFPRQSSRHLSPRSIAASVRRGRKLLDTIERYSQRPNTQCHCAAGYDACEIGTTCDVERRRKQQLTRAINNLAWWARSLSERNRRAVDAAYRERPCSTQQSA
jgi:hypothetical protein